MRVLCVSPLFPPTVNAEAVCAAKWALALIARGVDLVVLADPPPKEGSPRDASVSWSALSARTVAVEVPAGLSRFSSGLATLSLGWRYRVGRLYPRWIERVVAKAKELHAAAAFDLVVSRSLPARGHLAGYWAARALGLPWAAIINDPWDYHLFPARVSHGSFDRRAVSNRWLARTLRDADAVFGPSARLNDYNRRLARSDRRIDVLPHVGWSLSNVASRFQSGSVHIATGRNACATQEEEFRLVHAGVLGREPLTGGRPAAGLLSALARFLSSRPEARGVTKLRLVGPEDADAKALAAKLGLGPDSIGIVSFAGRVSYEESLREIASASACVLVEARMEEGIYLPSKFADYVAAAKPVLALSPAKGTLADYASGEKSIVRVDVDDEPAIARSITDLYDAWRTDRLASLKPSEKLQSIFCPDSIADAFLASTEERKHG